MACLYTLPKTNFILYFFISKATTLHHFAFPKANKCSLILKKCQPNFSMRKDTAFTQKKKKKQKTKNKIGLSKQKESFYESLEGEVQIFFFFFNRYKLVLDITIQLKFLVIEAVSMSTIYMHNGLGGYWTAFGFILQCINFD